MCVQNLWMDLLEETQYNGTMIVRIGKSMTENLEDIA